MLLPWSGEHAKRMSEESVNKGERMWYYRGKGRGDGAMEELLEWLEIIEDPRQQAKVRHRLTDIVALVMMGKNCKKLSVLTGKLYALIWSVESMHWHLDVTFREDANRTLDKVTAQNQNILRKWALSILKLVDSRGRKMSLKRKHYNISMNPRKYLDQVFAL